MWDDINSQKWTTTVTATHECSSLLIDRQWLKTGCGFDTFWHLMKDRMLKRVCCVHLILFTSLTSLFITVWKHFQKAAAMKSELASRKCLTWSLAGGKKSIVAASIFLRKISWIGSHQWRQGRVNWSFSNIWRASLPRNHVMWTV